MANIITIYAGLIYEIAGGTANLTTTKLAIQNLCHSPKNTECDTMRIHRLLAIWPLGAKGACSCPYMRVSYSIEDKPDVSFASKLANKPIKRNFCIIYNKSCKSKCLPLNLVNWRYRCVRPKCRSFHHTGIAS